LDCSDTQISAASLDYLYSHVGLTMLRARNIDIKQEQIDDFITSYSKRNAECMIVITPK
jgi:hypothetical protein